MSSVQLWDSRSALLALAHSPHFLAFPLGIPVAVARQPSASIWRWQAAAVLFGAAAAHHDGAPTAPVKVQRQNARRVTWAGLKAGWTIPPAHGRRLRRRAIDQPQPADTLTKGLALTDTCMLLWTFQRGRIHESIDIVNLNSFLSVGRKP